MHDSWKRFFVFNLNIRGIRLWSTDLLRVSVLESKSCWQCAVMAALFPVRSHFISLSALKQQSPTFLTPGTGFVEDSVATDQGGGIVWG